MLIENLLEVEIDSEFEKLSEMEVGSEKYKTTIDGLTKLLDRSIELEKISNEQDDREMTRINEESFRRVQLESEKKDRLIKNCLTATGIVIPSIITIWGTLKSLKFEEEGTITTAIGRGFINKLLPKK